MFGSSNPAHISHGRAWIWVALLAVIMAAIVGYAAAPADAGLPAYVALQHPGTIPAPA